MADNDLTVVDAAGNVRILRSFDLGSSVYAQGAAVELPEAPVNPSGGLIRYSVTTTATPLDPPSALARFGRLRVYHSAGNSAFRLYYRQDGTSPTANGANAPGFLLHGESILVRLAQMTNFIMIGESGMTGTFEVYVEWLNPSPT